MNARGDLMTIAETIRELKAANAELAAETFGDVTSTPQVVQSQGDLFASVNDLFGKQVPISQMLREVLFEVNGGANIVFGQRWLSRNEMADPFGDDAKFLHVFDPIGNVSSAKEPFFDQLEEDVYAYQEALGLEPTGKIANNENLVLLGYSLVELGTRPTYLFFEKGNDEPKVWSSAIDWIQTYENIHDFLSAFIE